MSHTAMMLIAGIGLLMLTRLVQRDAARATRLFLILWLIVSIGNLLVGVLYAGYGWSEEAAIWLLVFGLPAAIALAARRIGG
ncbi:MAG: hypothetical protein CVT78_04715 [Alphaproteobacteria bacterium HGW-Alphaproteobacteria-17]|uniref:hypothetical protein n=1 Tax=Sphingopyxis solisilvae TaxID=1886788 RepID=UPI000CB2AE22|nr:MAG: hypothetical protein CVT78_04715 [Alphaproteobacteria bacterium HGW-Alphaproteobacteria-17]